MPVFLDTTDPDFEIAFSRLLTAKREDSPDVDDTVAAIIADVRARGDAALIDYTARFDRLELTPERLAFTPEEIEARDGPDAIWRCVNERAPGGDLEGVQEGVLWKHFSPPRNSARARDILARMPSGENLDDQGTGSARG